MQSKQVFFDPTGYRWFFSRIILFLVLCNIVVFGFLVIHSFLTINRSDLVVTKSEFRNKIDQTYAIVADIDNTKNSQFSSFKSQFEEINELNCVCAQVSQINDQVVISSAGFTEWNAIERFEGRFKDKKSATPKNLSLTQENIIDISDRFISSSGISILDRKYTSIHIDLPEESRENIPQIVSEILQYNKPVFITVNPVSFYLYERMLYDFSRDTSVTVPRLIAQVYTNQGKITNTIPFIRDVKKVSNQLDAELYTSLPHGGYYEVDGVRRLSSVAYIQNQIEENAISSLEYNEQNFGFYLSSPLQNHVMYTDISYHNFLSLLLKNSISVDGFHLRQLHNETDNIISTIQSFSDDANPQSTYHFHPQIERKGEGAITRFEQGDPGVRSFTYSDDGMIEAITLETYPQVHTVYHSGDVKHFMSLSFDDGPHPVYTPEILDILKKERVKATFYVTGKNASSYPEIINRIIDEGHEIGNHTYNHEPLPNLQSQVIKDEILQTQNIIETISGVRPQYFRTPFNDNPLLEKFGDARISLIAQDLGLVVSEFDTDPRDWDGKNAEAIVRESLINPKSQLLLHDSGGTSRRPTVEALPGIISGYRDSGYQFVTISQLDGIQNAPSKSTKTSDMVAATISFLVKNITHRTFYRNSNALILFAIQAFVGISSLLLFAIRGSWLLKQVTSLSRRNRVKSVKIYTPPVSIIVPAYNESAVIQKTIQSLLKQKYPRYEILVIDDGSTDDTYQKAAEIATNYPHVYVHTKENGGKAMALNYGIAKARYDNIVLIDADTQIEKTAIRLMIKHFINPDIGAVAGNVQVGNDYFTQLSNGVKKPSFNLLTILQRLEYIIGQNIFREAYEFSNIITVVSGAIGLYRKQAILEVGGVSNDTLAEDGNLSFDILRAGWKIVYERKAQSFTEAPESISALYKQRFRWSYGTLQVLWKNRDVFFNPRYDFLGYIALPFSLVGIIGVLIAPILFSYTVWLYIQEIVVGSDEYLSTLFTVFESDAILQWWLMYLLVEGLFVACALVLDPSKNKYVLLFFVPIHGLLTNTFLGYVLLRSILSILKGEARGWGHLKRTGSVSISAPQKPLIH